MLGSDYILPGGKVNESLRAMLGVGPGCTVHTGKQYEYAFNYNRHPGNGECNIIH